MAIDPITPPTAAPIPGDPSFREKASAFVTWLCTVFVVQLNTLIAQLNALIVAVPGAYLQAATFAEALAMLRMDVVLTPARQVGHGECYLKRISATQIRLDPEGPGRIMVKTAAGWGFRVLGADGVTLDVTAIQGAAAGQKLYIYAVASGDTGLALEASATGHVLDKTSGKRVEVKSDDPTRTLVGMVYLNPSVQFQDDPAFRGVLSFFNRQPKELRVDEPNYYTLAATSTETLIGSSPLKFLSWAGPTDLRAQAQAYAAASMAIYPAIDGVAVARNVETVLSWLPVHVSTTETVAEGWHTFDVMYTSASGISYWGSNTASPAKRWGRKFGTVWG